MQFCSLHSLTLTYFCGLELNSVILLIIFTDGESKAVQSKLFTQPHKKSLAKLRLGLRHACFRPFPAFIHLSAILQTLWGFYFVCTLFKSLSVEPEGSLSSGDACFSKLSLPATELDFVF